VGWGATAPPTALLPLPLLRPPGRSLLLPGFPWVRVRDQTRNKPAGSSVSLVSSRRPQVGFYTTPPVGVFFFARENGNLCGETLCVASSRWFEPDSKWHFFFYVHVYARPHTRFFYVKSAQICLRQASRLNLIRFALPDRARTKKGSGVSCLPWGLHRAPDSDEAPR